MRRAIERIRRLIGKLLRPSAEAPAVGLAPIPAAPMAPLSREERFTLESRLSRLDQAPSVTLITFPGDRTAGAMERTHRALGELVYGKLETLALDFPDAGDAAVRPLNEALGRARGDLVGFVAKGDVLAPEALVLLAEAAARAPAADCLYTDEDRIEGEDRLVDPFFKPDWSPSLLLAQPYILRLALYRRSLLLELGGVRAGFAGGWQHDLALRHCELAREVVHVPQVLYHRGGTRPDLEGSVRAVMEAIRRRGRTADVGASPVPGVLRVSRKPAGTPPVDILIPTRDRIDLLRECVESVLARTSYPAFTITIIDNESRKPATLDQFRRWAGHPRIRFHPAGGRFNFSRLNNSAARASPAQFLLLLNNDTRVITADWLCEMVAWAEEPGVGAVGAKLLYPDGRIQHAGIVLGIGRVASHTHKHFPPGHPGYQGLLHSVREVSAVTGACLLTRRETYLDLGGLEEGLPQAYNDVDYCLRLLARGHRVLYVPLAELYHHESMSRGGKRRGDGGFDDAVRFMLERWDGRLEVDRYYSPRLSMRATDYAPRESS